MAAAVGSDSPETRLWQWQLDRIGRTWQCELVQTAMGVEGRCFVDDDLVARSRFPQIAAAIDWADRRCAELRSDRFWNGAVSAPREAADGRQ